jgi:hypothetical protein
MNRILAFGLMATLSISVFASSTTSDQHIVKIQNSETTEAFSLNTETYKTEYKIETIQNICYRQVFNGYQTVCNGYQFVSERSQGRGEDHHENRGGDRDGDHRDNRGGHRDGDHGRDHEYPRPQRPVCYSVPMYRTESYSCLQSVSVPYEVFDHQSTTNVNVVMSAAPETKQATGNCGINFNLTGDHLTSINTCNDYLAFANKTGENHGNFNSFNYTIKLVDAQLVMAPLAGNLQEMHINGSELIVRTGNLSDTARFNLKLYVQRRKLFKKDIVLIERVLKASEFSYQATDMNTGYVHIDLQKLIGNFEPNKKNIIRLNLDLNIDTTNLIKNSSLPKFNQEASITTH